MAIAEGIIIINKLRKIICFILSPTFIYIQNHLEKKELETPREATKVCSKFAMFCEIMI